MGTKSTLAPDVADAVATLPPGPFIDSLCGMCSVTTAIGIDRQVGAIDAQYYAAEYATALFKSEVPSKTVCVIINNIHAAYTENKDHLNKKYKSQIIDEDASIASADLCSAIAANRIGQELLSEYTSRRQIDINATAPRSYDLFTLAYAGTYFSLQQCIEIDSIRYALETLFRQCLITQDEFRWGIIAIGTAMQRAATSTGHFAQYLEPKADTVKRHIAQRRKSVWHSFCESLSDAVPAGSGQWRSRNKTFRGDCLEILKSDQVRDWKPAVIYADPPYTEDQYSRYYHLLETLVLYDFPDIAHKGRYRGERFQTPFSCRSKVANAFHCLVQSCASIGADIVLSYPTNGLLHEIDIQPLSILAEYYPDPTIFRQIAHEHSTLGASKGTQVEPVTEIIYVAKRK